MNVGRQTRQLQKSIVICSAFAILVVGVVVALASIWPLFLYLKFEEERNLTLALNGKAAAVEEYLLRVEDVAIQIASRTTAREVLQAYQEGLITLEEATEYTRRTLSDAVKQSQEIWGITRQDLQGTIVAELGVEIPAEARCDASSTGDKMIFSGPFTIGRHTYLVVNTPIMGHDNTMIGRDAIVFRLYHLAKIVQDPTGLGRTGVTVLGWLRPDAVTPVFPFKVNEHFSLDKIPPETPIGKAMNKAAQKLSGVLLPNRDYEGTEVIAYSPIRNRDWAIVLKVDQEELYAPVYHHVITTAYLIVALILVGTLGMVLVVRPLTGKMLIRTDELERQIAEKTAQLQKELHERRKMLQWLRDSERRYRVLVEEVPDVIFLLDQEGHFVFINTEIENFLEYSVRDMLDKRIQDLVPPEDHSKIQTLFQIEPDRIWDEEVCLIDAKGARKFARIRCKFTEAEESHPRRYEGVMRDITRRKKLEEELRHSREELLEKIRIIDDLYEHIVQSGKSKAISDHTAEVAHELRQPLAIVGGFARRMAKALNGETTSVVPEQREYCRIMISEICRLERILDSLIDFTRRSSLKLTKADPNQIIRNVLRVYEEKLGEKNLQLVTNLGEEVNEIDLDPERFEQVVRNLLSNAVEASPQDATIYIESGVSIPSGKAYHTGQLEAENYFELKIRNSGKEIPPEDLQKIFNPFYTTKDFGTGIGLTLTKRIVEDHNGSISVKSDQESTVFTVWLPLEQPEATKKNRIKARGTACDPQQ